MSDFLVEDVAVAIGGKLLQGAARMPLNGISTDTRQLGEGELFFALSGPNYDGNQFASAAASAGAGCIVLRAEPGLLASLPAILGPDCVTAVIAHEDPKRALGELASWHRRRLGLPVVGITGSCGKTTTKNYLVQLLSSVREVVGSPLSYNNNIGVPLTLLAANGASEVLVAEMGTNSPGEIGALCQIATPNAGIITNIGASHLEGLGSLEGIAMEKAELARSLPSRGFLVLNDDCRYSELFRASTKAKVISFSIEGSGDLNATDLWFNNGHSIFRLNGFEVTLPALGTHNVQNLLAALAACVGLGISLESVLPGVAGIKGQSGRLEAFELGGLHLIDDTYNANPESARAAVRVLAGMHGFKSRVLVLGDMLELGDFAAEMHHELGRLAVASGVDRIVLIGELTRASAAGALEAGIDLANVVHYATLAEAQAETKKLFRKGDVVLIKGSRGMALERLAKHIRKTFPVPKKSGGGGKSVEALLARMCGLTLGVL
jgi:UDP-N-acetylmuramoyl-tripeptide--D-alanyl-D-alanine ligase